MLATIAIWIGIGSGIVIIAGGIAALIRWLLTRDESGGRDTRNAPADHRSIGVAGDAGPIIQHHGSGDIVIVTNQAVTLPPTESASPALELRGPDLVQTPMYRVSPTGTEQIDTVDLWRVSVDNLTRGTKATGVSVRLESSSPALRYGKIKLHRTGDDIWPYEQDFVVRYDEPVLVDVMAMSRQTGDIYLWRSEQPGYAFPVTDDEKNLLRDHLQEDGASLTLKATADNADPVSQDYLLHIVDGQLMMRTRT